MPDFAYIYVPSQSDGRKSLLIEPVSGERCYVRHMEVWEGWERRDATPDEILATRGIIRVSEFDGDGRAIGFGPRLNGSPRGWCDRMSAEVVASWFDGCDPDEFRAFADRHGPEWLAWREFARIVGAGHLDLEHGFRDKLRYGLTHGNIATYIGGHVLEPGWEGFET